ncbi:hypothetical protein MRB53_014713 [Persea americana]|uniref:Uncharacterized protein n=1 Tax=Persea americana TaxID=3435 RepID=A0ACC2KC38_PERAE|nr:hypothetical protein MRB53_014713 [Persea americana]
MCQAELTAENLILGLPWTGIVAGSGEHRKMTLFPVVMAAVSLGWRLPLFETAEDGPSLRQKTADVLEDCY